MSASRVITYRREDAPAAVVFLHGFLGGADDTWHSFATRFCADERVRDWDVHSYGYPTHWMPDKPWAWRSDPEIRTIAQALTTDATRTDAFRPYRRLILVAHSMGGLAVQRALLDDETLRRRTDLVVIYGTPSAGLKAATFISFLKRQVRDLAYGSPFITRLRSDWAALHGADAPPFRFWTVAGMEDSFVPRYSSLDPFPRPEQAVVPGDHLELVDPVDPEHRAVTFLVNALVGDREPAGPWNSAAVAVERGEFLEAIRTLEPNRDRLDRFALGRLALAYSATGRGDEAIAVLEGTGEAKGTDLMGILAGQRKRRWLHDRLEADASEALRLYERALELAEGADDPEQAYYHAVNVAFMQFAFARDRKAARETATRALEHCRRAESHLWRTATEAEAQLYLGDLEAALERYRAALDLAPTPRERESIYLQAQAVLGLTDPGDPALDRLNDVFGADRP